MNSLELFSGAGGLAKGLEISGFKHSALVEKNKHAYASLCENFDVEKVFFGDIKDFDLETLNNIDIVAGGPPCQPFSLGGKHKADQDSRDMFPYAIRAIEKLKPKAFIFENVKGLLRQTFADYFEYIILRLTYPSFTAEATSDWQQHLDELRTVRQLTYAGTKYNVQFKLINAANYGVPQTRERVVIIGVRSDLNCFWLFPPETHSADRLFWDMHVTGEYWEQHKIGKLERPIFDKSVEVKIFRFKEKYGLFEPVLMPWQTVRDALGNLPDPKSNHGISDHTFRDGARIYPGHTGSTLDLPAKTIKAGDHGVPGGENMIRFPDKKVRYLTVFEAKRLQTFPDDFVIMGGWGEAMRQVGNAVPVILAQIIGYELVKTLNTHNQSLASEQSSIWQLVKATNR
jgi:DNA (cytosine-5)-methyltransferase 1